MGLLGDGWDDPRSMATLQLAAGLLGPGGLGQGLSRGLQGYQGAMAADAELKVKKAQLDNIAAEAALRQQKAAQEQRKLDYFFGSGSPGPSAASQALAGGGGPTMENAARMGATASEGRFGAVPEQIARAEYAFNDGKNIPQMMWDAAKPKMEWQSGVLVDSNKTKPGTSLPQISQNGTASQLIADPSAPGGFRVILPQGAAQTAAANSIATQLPSALINAGTRREDFKNPDGTTRSVTGLQFGKESGGLDALMDMLGKLGQPAPAQAAPVPQVAPTQRPIAPVQASQVPPAVQATRDAQAGQLVALSEYAGPDGQKRAQNDLKSLQNELLKAKTPEQRSIIQGQIRVVQPAAAGVQSGQSSQTVIGNEAQGAINNTWLKSSYEPTVAAGSAARDMLASVQTARVGLANVGSTGWGKETQLAAAKVLAALGVPQADKAATGAQVFEQAAGARLNSVLQSATGVQTEGDAQRATKLFAKVGNTPDANKFILDMAQAIAERDAKKASYYKEALPFAREKGDLQEVDRRWSKIEPSIWDLPIMKKWKQ